MPVNAKSTGSRSAFRDSSNFCFGVSGAAAVHDEEVRHDAEHPLLLLFLDLFLSHLLDRRRDIDRDSVEGERQSNGREA
jgi:hypothetical protein